jgi:RNA recognition motif-containing protein
MILIFVYRFGEIGDVYIPRIHGTMDPRGFAFVRFVDLRDAEDAIKEMDDKEVEGRVIKVALGTNKRPERR